MHKAVFKNRFGNQSRALRYGQHSHKLCLHIRRKARIWHGLDIHCLRTLIAGYADAVHIFFNGDTSFL